MKNVLTYVTLILVFAFQTTIGRYIEIFNVMPNLMLVLAVCYSIYAVPVKATVFSLCAGILMDVFAAKHLGINALMMMYLGMMLSCITSGYIRTNFVMALITVGISTILYEGLYGFLLYFIFSKTTLSTMFSVVFIEVLYNMIVACGIYWLGRYLAYDEIRSF